MKTAEQRRKTLKLPARLGDEFMHYQRAEALDGDQLWSQGCECREGTDPVWRYEMVVSRCPGR